MDINNLTNDDIEFMRGDLESGMGYSKMIMYVKNKMEAEGKDFMEEFRKWKEKQKDNN